MKQSLLLAFVMCLSGCIVYDAGYTENVAARKYRIPESERIPASYSIRIELQRNDSLAEPTYESVNEKIKAALEASGMFSQLTRMPKVDERGYHFEFLCRQGGFSPEERATASAIAGGSLFLVPIGEVLCYDLTAVVYFQGKPIYSTAKAEEERELTWLPLLPFGVVFNTWTAAHSVELGLVNAAVNDVVLEHRRRYLGGVDVQEVME